MKNILLSIFGLLVTVSLFADSWNFDPQTKYRVECIALSPSAMALGANHNLNTPLCITSTDYKDSDCYWYFKEEETGKYSIQNASTYQYLTYDEFHESSPQTLRYVHLSSELEGETSLWYIGQLQTTTYGNVYYIQSVAAQNMYFHMRSGSTVRVLGPYSNSPNGTSFQFKFYDANDQEFKPDGKVDPIVVPDRDDPEPVVVDSAKALKPISGQNIYIYRADGRVDVIPQEYVTNRVETSEGITITTIADTTFSYIPLEVDSITTVSPELPSFGSFKFNNKFNHHIIEDAQGVFYGDTLITLNVVGIGKTLTPSFKLDVDVTAYIDGVRQTSKKDHVRFSNDVIYTVARRGLFILRQNLNGDFVMRPYGREVKVSVDFATDHYTTTYRVPTVYITTNNGTSITSKYYYWDAKIKIDGAGVFPDMDTTPIQIKGRGNSSWTSSGKAPYHLKFEEALKPFGLTKGKHWNLLANALSYSMECNAIAMKAAQLVETAGFNHMIPVDLYINGEYRGAYNFTEKVGFANNSIDLADETYCAMYELDSYYDEAYKFRSTYYSLPVNIKEPDFDDTEKATPLTMDMVKEPFNLAMAALYNQENTDFYFDFDYMAKFLFVDELTANYELFHPKSTFCYAQNLNDSSTKLIFGPVWDYDWCFGGPSTYFARNETDNYWEKSSGDGRVWAKAMRYNVGTEFDKTYYRLWYDFVNNHLDELIDFVDDYYNYVKYSYTHNSEKWKNGDADYYYNLKEKAKTWITNRANHCLNYMTNDLGYSKLNYLVTETEKPTIGDVNEDGRITTADVVCALNYLLGLPNESFDYQQADTDRNDIITIGDVQKVRSLTRTISSKGFYGLPEADAVITTGTVEYTNEGITVPLIINVDEAQYSGIQFDLKVPAGMVVEDLDISKSIPNFDVNIDELDPSVSGDVANDCYRVSIYSGGNNVLPQDKSVIELQLGWGSSAHEPGVQSVNLANVMFVSSVAEDYRSLAASAQFTADELTGINDAISLASQDGNHLTFRTNEQAVLPIYTLDGRIFRLYNLTPGTQTVSLPRGIYIINKQKISVK